MEVKRGYSGANLLFQIGFEGVQGCPSAGDEAVASAPKDRLAVMSPNLWRELLANQT